MSEELIRLAAEKAISFIEDDMTIGVGTGSTVNYFIEKLASIKHLINAAVPSSKDTEKKLRDLGIPVIELNSAQTVDLYIDGADEVSADLSMTKGGGGALLWEKIVAQNSKKRIYMADSTKLVRELGQFPLPIEVVLFGHEWTCIELKKFLPSVSIRKTGKGDIFKTNSGNIIYDCKITDNVKVSGLDTDLSRVPGVITTGLFVDFIDILITVRNESVIEIETDREVFW